MNWIKKIISVTEKIKKRIRVRPSAKEISESLYYSCCSGPQLKSQLQDNLYVCPNCKKTLRLPSNKDRFDIFFSGGSYKVISTPSPIEDPLLWEDASGSYKDKLKKAKKNTGQEGAITVAHGTLKGGMEIISLAVNFNFIGGSMGQNETEAFIYAVQESINKKIPLVAFASGGGQRLHESPIALMGMTKTTLAVNELKMIHKIPYIVVFVSPCAGGITASWASLSDISISEPGATVAFAGRRVIENSVRETLPENFQTAETLRGFIDIIVERKDISTQVEKLLKILLKKHVSESSFQIENSTENTRTVETIAS